MTQQTDGMPELNYSEETFRDLYEALEGIIKGVDSGKEVIGYGREQEARKALAKARVK